MVVQLTLTDLECCTSFGTIVARSRLTNNLLPVTPNFIQGSESIELEVDVTGYENEGFILTTTFCGQTKSFTIMNLLDVKVKASSSDCQAGFLSEKFIFKVNNVPITPTIEKFNTNGLPDPNGCVEKLSYNLTTQHLNLGDLIPSGIITAYYGDISWDSTGLGLGDLLGWAVCNGNNGTPDLRNRFIRGFPNITTPYAHTTGGSAYPFSFTLSSNQLPPHKHPIPSNVTNSNGDHNHTGWTDFFGDHQHPYPSNNDGGTSVIRKGQAPPDGTDYLIHLDYINSMGYSDFNDYINGQNHRHKVLTNNNGAHTHTIPASETDFNNVGSQQAVTIQPPQFSQLVFIMKL